MTRGFEWLGREHGNVAVSLLRHRHCHTQLLAREVRIDKRLNIDLIRLSRNIRRSMATAISKEEYEARRQVCRRLAELEVLDTLQGGE